MAQHKHFDPLEVRRAYLVNGGNVNATAKALGTSRETVYSALDRAQPPLVVPSVSIKGLDPASPDSQAVASYVRQCLDRAGIRQGDGGSQG